MVERGGQNAVLDRLKKELYIPKSHARTQGNTRLALRSKPVEMLQMVIDEQLKGNKYHDLMYTLYVSSLSNAELMLKYRMTEPDLEETLKETEGPPPYLEDFSLENFGCKATRTALQPNKKCLTIKTRQNESIIVSQWFEYKDDLKSYFEDSVSEAETTYFLFRNKELNYPGTFIPNLCNEILKHLLRLVINRGRKSLELKLVDSLINDIPGTCCCDTLVLAERQ